MTRSMDIISLKLRKKKWKNKPFPLFASVCIPSMKKCVIKGDIIQKKVQADTENLFLF